MPMNSFVLLILILFIYQSQSGSFQSNRPYRRQRSTLQKLQLNQCSYGGGTINNSTVIQLGNCFNDFYFIGLNIGTQPQYFNFQFDTGSPTLWIPEGTNPSGFNQMASSTYSITNQSNQITYGDGTQVSGYMGYDILSISQTSITTNYSILFATQSNVTYDNTSVYGLVGMDYNSYPNFLDLAYQKGQISTPVFSLQLKNTNQTSIMYYNNGLPKIVKQNTVWVSMSGPSQFWQLQLLAFSIGGIDMTNSAASIVVIDSGTSLLALNQDLYQSIVQTYFSNNNCEQNSGSTICYCNATWPDLSFMLNGIEVYVPGQFTKSNVGNGVCQLQMQPTSGNQIILGDTFFREYIITFDRPNLRLGFYGTYTPIQTYDPQYFVLIQYIMCGACVWLGFVGIGLWIYVRSAFQKRLQSTLGTELIRY